MSPADFADNADEPQTPNGKTTKATPHQPVFLCGIMQLAAFLCVISVICGRITRKHTQSIHTNETPMSPADLADDADEPQNHNNRNNHTTPNLSFSAK